MSMHSGSSIAEYQGPWASQPDNVHKWALLKLEKMSINYWRFCFVL